MTDFPTQMENTLDIFYSNRPTLIHKCTPFPGLSDHDMVLVDTNIIPKRQKPVQCRIYLWKRDTESMKNELCEFSMEFSNSYDTSTPVNTLWTKFQQKCIETIKLSFLRKRLRPALTSLGAREVKRQARRKKRAYKKARQTKLQTDWNRYKDIQHNHQTTCRNARNSYVREMVSNPELKTRSFTLTSRV